MRGGPRRGPGRALSVRGRERLPYDTDGFRTSSGVRQHALYLTGEKLGENSLLRISGFTGHERSQLSFFAADAETLKSDLKANPLSAEDRDSFGQDLLQIWQAFARRSRDGAEPASASLARRAVRLLEGAEVRVERVAQRLGVTARHLRRAFAESVGIGPKDFARTVRLQRAVRRVATSCDWGRIATDVGYYDQAHLIGEFRELVGLTPVAFAKRRRDPARPAMMAAQISPDCAPPSGHTGTST